MMFNIDVCYEGGVVTVGRETSASLARTRMNTLTTFLNGKAVKARVYDQRKMKEVYVVRRTGLIWEAVEPNSIESMEGKREPRHSDFV